MPRPPLDFRFVLVAAFVFLLASTTPLAHAFDLPEYRGPVNDYASMFSPRAQDELERELRAYQAQTGHQFAVLTIATLGGLTIEDYSHRAAVSFRLGSAKADDGLLLVIAKRERKVRIEVGYGLEGSIPDAVAARVIRQTLRPALARGDFAAGVLAAFRTLMRAAGNQDVGSVPTASAQVALSSSLYMRDDAEFLSVDARRHIAEQLERLALSTRHTLAFVSVRCPRSGAIEACMEQADQGSTGLYARGVALTLVIFIRPIEGGSEIGYHTRGSLAEATFDHISDDLLKPRILTDADGAVEDVFRELVVLSGGQWQVRPEPDSQAPSLSQRAAASGLSAARQRSDDATLAIWLWLAGGCGFLWFWVWLHRKVGETGGGGSWSSDGSSSSWSSGDSGGSSSSDSSSSGGGGDFGGGGASGDW